MLLNGKRIKDLTLADLEALIGREEDKTIEFKEDAYPKQDERKKKALLDDVCAFANASGGWIICGIKESDGKASEICGLGAITTDGEIRRLRQTIEQGIEPKITSLEIEHVNLSDIGKGHAIVFYIPRSFAAPHRVKETRRFQVRRNKGNDEMDMDEIRTAFGLSESYIERIRNFRKKRIEILSDDEHEESPVKFEEGYKVVLHVVPLASFGSLNKVSLTDKRFLNNVFSDPNDHNRFLTKVSSNFDGLIMPVYYHIGICEEYYQIFRDGGVEYVRINEPSNPFIGDQSRKFFFPTSMESDVVRAVRVSLDIQHSLGVTFPYVVMLTLLDVKNRYYYRDGREHPPRQIYRSNMLIPEVIVESLEEDITKQLRPMFDIVWNAGGFNASPNYKPDGTWHI